MDQGSGKILLLLTALALAAALVACGSEKETMPPATGTMLSASTPTAGLNVCIGCHAQETADWLTTKHANLDPAGNLYSYGVPTIGIVKAGGAGCVACHDPNGDSNSLTAGHTGATGIKRPVIGCESCHGPGSLHVEKGGVGPISLLSGTLVSGSIGTVQVSGQFRMCTSCHELLNTAGTGTIAAEHDTGGTSPTGSQYTITDTHFAVGGDFTGTKGANKNNITGYAMNFADETVCIGCHNPHTGANINREWAISKHAGWTKPSAWAHYNWSCDVAANCGGLGTSGDRRSCQRCHTTSTFAAYADALGAGKTAQAEAIWTGGALAYDPKFKPEMLECKGCHTNNRGTVRNPGPYTASYKIPIGGYPVNLPINAAVSFSYPDIAASNVCMPCHTGRGNGKAIHSLNTGQTATVNFGSQKFLDGHYLTAGGTMFKGTGYEYSGRSYADDPASFQHDKIGTSDFRGTGTNGPCIGCHMERPGLPGNHLFEPVSTNTTTINVSSELCFNCHAGSSIELGAEVQKEKDNFEFGLEALEAELASSGSWTFSSSNPYFIQTNWLSAGDTDVTGNTTGKNNLGAAFNFSLLHHEPGAYVHNSRYVRRLIYDSIDWLDDGKMNYSAGATLDDACTATPQPWCAGAMQYILPNGVKWSGSYPDGYGVDNERP